MGPLALFLPTKSRTKHVKEGRGSHRNPRFAPRSIDSPDAKNPENCLHDVGGGFPGVPVLEL